MRYSMLTVASCFMMMAGIAMAGDQPSSASTGNAKSTEDMCRETICQHNVHVLLKQKDGSVFDRTFEVMPGVVQPRWLVILAGQTLHIEADRVEDHLSNFRVVESVTHPEKTLALALQQSADGGMVLTVHNPFNQALKFNMGMMPLDNERLLKTSSCPVVAGGSSFESWPYPLFQVVLANARFIDLGKGKVACE